MSGKIQISTVSSFQLDGIRFDKLYRTANGITKANVKYNGKRLLLRGPPMYLNADIIKCGDDYYIDLAFDLKSRKNKEFCELIRNVDYLAISEVFDNAKLWYPEQSQQVCLIQVEKEYIPSIKLSTLHAERYCLKIKANSSTIEFYDSDNVEIPYQLLKENYTATPLLQLSAIYREGSHVWAEWELIQLKVDIPEKIFNGCQLTDINDDSSEEDAINEDDFY